MIDIVYKFVKNESRHARSVPTCVPIHRGYTKNWWRDKRMKLSLIFAASCLLIGCAEQIPEVRSYPSHNFWTYKTVEVKQDNSWCERKEQEEKESYQRALKQFQEMQKRYCTDFPNYPICFETFSKKPDPAWIQRLKNIAGCKSSSDTDSGSTDQDQNQEKLLKASIEYVEQYRTAHPPSRDWLDKIIEQRKECFSRLDEVLTLCSIDKDKCPNYEIYQFLVKYPNMRQHVC